MNWILFSRCDTEIFEWIYILIPPLENIRCEQNTAKGLGQKPYNLMNMCIVLLIHAVYTKQELFNKWSACDGLQTPPVKSFHIFAATQQA